MKRKFLPRLLLPLALIACVASAAGPAAIAAPVTAAPAPTA